MKRILVSCVLTVCTSAVPVGAQVADRGYGQLNVGASSGAALVSLEGGVALGANVETFAELGWISHMQPARLGTSASTIAAFLQATTGQPATFSAKTPTFIGSLGARYFVGRTSGFRFSGISGIRPYGLLGFGFARIDQRVHFSLAGSDVTSRLRELGVTLGQDLSGSPAKGTAAAGLGVLVPVRSLQIDLGYRYTRVFTRIGTDAHRVYLGGRHRF